MRSESIHALVQLPIRHHPIAAQNRRLVAPSLTEVDIDELAGRVQSFRKFQIKNPPGIENPPVAKTRGFFR
jgi:hypothetical protein